MDRDMFIITVYCVVVEPYQALTAHRSLRQGGFSPTLSDDEVLTMAICGADCKLPSDKDMWPYFRTHSHPCFPARGDRSLWVRQAANLWQSKAAIQQRLTPLSGQAPAPVHPLATLP